MPAGESPIPALASVLRRYCFAYTASHDISVCDDIMVEDYVLRMGNIDIRGRDDHYKPAAEKQYRQFPGLGMSVHALLVTPDRAAMHFSEYGRSLLTGTEAAWSGISLYRWDGEHLTECRVEQDYYARRRQLRSAQPDVIAAPARDPWTRPVEQADTEVESTIRRWLSDGGIARLPHGCLDDEAQSPGGRIVLAGARYEILDCFAGTEHAAFHVAGTGVIDDWPGAAPGTVGRVATVYYAGLVRLHRGKVVEGRVISDRLAAERRALAA